MRPARRLMIFLLLTLGIDAAMVIPWFGFPWLYRRVFAVVLTLLFGSFGGQVGVRFDLLPQPTDAGDVQAVLTNISTMTTGTFEISTTETALMPTAFLVALVLATPLPRRRRVKALLWGLLWINLLVGARVLLSLLQALSDDDDLAVFHWPPWWRNTLIELSNDLASPFAGWFLLPLVLWIAMTFRRGDWSALMDADSRRIGRV